MSDIYSPGHLIKRFLKTGQAKILTSLKVIFFEQKLFFRNLGLNLVKKNAFYKYFYKSF